MIYGILAIILTIIHLIAFLTHKETKLWATMALSMTVVAILDFYRVAANMVVKEDWIALLDTMPYINNYLWYLGMGAIILNLLPMMVDFFKKEQ